MNVSALANYCIYFTEKAQAHFLSEIFHEKCFLCIKKCTHFVHQRTPFEVIVQKQRKTIFVL